MAFKKLQPDTIENSKQRHKKTAVRVKRSYYTFSKYYPAGDTNRVYRKSISKAKREKRSRIFWAVGIGLAVLAIVLLLILI